MNAECAKNPRVPGNYEPGDGSDGHEIPELEQYLGWAAWLLSSWAGWKTC